VHVETVQERSTRCRAVPEFDGVAGPVLDEERRVMWRWRWLLGREDTPWYPSMRLYRQATPGDWPGR